MIQPSSPRVITSTHVEWICSSVEPFTENTITNMMADVAAAHGWDADPVDLLLVALVRTGIARSRQAITRAGSASATTP